MSDPNDLNAEELERLQTEADHLGLGVDVVFHSLRNTYISRLAMAGVDIRTVQELAGHKSITMTMRYAHLAPQHKQKALALLENDVTPNLTPIAVAHQ